MYPMIRREQYLHQLQKFKGTPLVKVLTGMRRSGKSTILAMYAQWLEESGVPVENIVLMNFESFGFSHVKTGDQLYAWLQPRLSKTSTTHVLLDEIQEVSYWEKAVNALMVDFKTDIVLTGSNSRMLSSELATFLTGRYVEIPVFTLSLKEVLSFKQAAENAPAVEEAFAEYLERGGFPILYSFPFDEESAFQVIADIYSSAILRDTVQRFGIRDVELLERLVRFLFDNVGKTFSAKSIADYFKSQQRKLDINTIYNYLNALESAFIIYRLQRYDIKGKELLKTYEKYFISDHGLIRAMLGHRPHHISGILENIIALELMRRGYKVYVGKLQDIEIDFVAEKKDQKLYVQVAYRMDDPSTLERERRPLLQVADNYPKYILTMDKLLTGNTDGILTRYLPDFLLSNDY